jgi:ankyrin repeat protein
VVRLLLAQDDVNVNLEDSDELTLLTMATLRGKEGAVKLLLARNDVDARTGI